jgi:hypothetical protein
MGHKKKPKRKPTVDAELKQVARRIKPETEKPTSVKYRVKVIAQGIVLGYTSGQLKYKYSREFGVRESTIANYIVQARRLIQEEILTDDADIRVDLLAKYQMLFRVAMERENFAEAKRVLDSIAKFTQTIRHDVTTNNNEIKTISLVEMVKDLDEAERNKEAKDKGYEDVDFEEDDE